MKKRVLLTALMVFAVLLQISVAPRVVVLGVKPDFLTIMVLSLALEYGSMTGLVTGFSGGLALDVLFGSPVGLRTLGLAVIGYVVGLSLVRRFRRIPRRLIVTAIFLIFRELSSLVFLFIQGVEMQGNMLLKILASVAQGVLFMIPLQLIMKRMTKKLWYMERKELTVR